MLRRLRRHEKEGLREGLLEQSVLFKAFQNPIREMEVHGMQTKGFHLAPEEVFWRVSVVLDKIKEQQRDALTDIRGLWNEVFADYRDLSDADNDDGVGDFASLTVFCIQVCLVSVDVPLYRTMAATLGEQLSCHNQPTPNITASVLNHIERIGADKFSTAVHTYMDSEEDWLSDEIEELTGHAEMSVATATPSEPSEPQMQIAKGKKTSLMVVLESIYKAGWIVDADGKTLTNRDNVINYILYRVFGQKEESIAQLINAAKNSIRNKQGIEKYFDELLSASTRE